MTNSNSESARRDEAISFCSDMSKDARGIRFRDFDGLTTKDIEDLGQFYADMVAREREDADPDAWKRYV